MSYILDALHRANAERDHRDPAERPDHSLLAAGSDRPGSSRSTAKTRLWIGALAALLLCAAGVGWWWHTRESMPPEPRPLFAATEMPSGSATAPTPPVASPPAPLLDTGPSKPAQPPQPILAPTSPAPATPPPRAREQRPDTMKALSPLVDKAPAPISPSPTEANVRSWAELSEETRAQLPPVNVSGSTWSQNKDLRMLIINGQVVHEGQTVAPGLVLESIGPASAVLNHRGLRYSITY